MLFILNVRSFILCLQSILYFV